MEENKKAKKPIFKRWWFWLIVVVIVIGVIGSQGDSETNTDDSQTAEQTQSATTEPTDAESEDAQQTAAPVEEPEDPADTMTMGQKNALGSAESYLSVTAFSRSGLIGQLEYEGYSTEDATFAADNCGADWNEQAAKSAQSYLEMSSFSRQGLIDQLLFEGFTQEQAEYGVTAAGY